MRSLCLGGCLGCLGCGFFRLHLIGWGLGLTCSKAAKSKACAILVSKLHKYCFLLLTYTRGRFYIVPTMPGLCIWAKSPTAQKSAHVWKRGLVRFSPHAMPLKKVPPGSHLATSFQKFIHKSFQVLFGPVLCLNFAAPAHIRMYLNVALMA